MTATHIEAAHWRDIPREHWPWRNFSAQEMACRGTGRVYISIALMDKLERLRYHCGDKPMIVRSAYRSPEHNAKVGGASNSRHKMGDAVDIGLGNLDGAEVEAIARSIGFTGIGRYPEPRANFIHLDLGPKRTWGSPWPKLATRFAEERPVSPATDPAVRKPAGGATAATAGAGAVQAVETALHDATGALTPLAETLDYAKYALIAVAVLLAGLAIYRAVKS